MGCADNNSRIDNSSHARLGSLQALDIPEIASISFTEVYSFFLSFLCNQDSLESDCGRVTWEACGSFN